MQKIIYICDRCGAQIEDRGYVIETMDVGDHYVNNARCVEGRAARHICKGCGLDLVDWIHGDLDMARKDEEPEKSPYQQTVEDSTMQVLKEKAEEHIAAMTDEQKALAVEVDDTRARIREEIKKKAVNPLVKVAVMPEKKSWSRKKIDVDMAKVLQLRSLGKSIAEIAEELGVSDSVIARRLRQADKGGNNTYVD